MQGRWRGLLVGVALLSWLGGVQSVSAQPVSGEAASAEAESNPSEDLARAHFHTGSLAFEGGHYAEALEEFQKAYALSQRPQLLYNIAVAADRQREDEIALRHFEQYLQQVPDAAERAQVTGRIAVLRRAVERTQAEDAESQATEIPPPVDSAGNAGDHRRSNLTPWLVFGASSAVTVAGGVLLTLAIMDRNSVQNADVGVRLSEIDGAYGRVPTLSWTGGVMLGVGLVGIGASIAWLTLTEDDSDGPQTTVAIGPGHFTVQRSW